MTVDGNTLTAGAGVRLKKLAYAARAAEIGGFEWMEGIPGNVGGSLRMNAGAMGTECFDQIVDVTYLDGEGDLRTKPVSGIDFHYRDVPEFTDQYVVAARFRGTAKPLAEIDESLAHSKEKRRVSQPIAASAGCVFKNPQTIPAGQLVDELGFKGKQIGQARVSREHGNFIVNRGGATAADVLALITEIQAAALAERGITLETEVQILGEDRVVF